LDSIRAALILAMKRRDRDNPPNLKHRIFVQPSPLVKTNQLNAPKTSPPLKSPYPPNQSTSVHSRHRGPVAPQFLSTRTTAYAPPLTQCPHANCIRTPSAASAKSPRSGSPLQRARSTCRLRLPILPALPAKVPQAQAEPLAGSRHPAVHRVRVSGSRCVPPARWRSPILSRHSLLPTLPRYCRHHSHRPNHPRAAWLEELPHRHPIHPEAPA
jgi:hypothetical protein